MKGTRFIFGPMWMSLILALFLVAEAPAQAPIVIGVPTSTGFVEGKEALQAVTMATEEINAKGGVQVGGEKRLLKVESIDIRDAAPGVPVPEALLESARALLRPAGASALAG